MTCALCGRRFNPSALYCGVCGAPLPARAAEAAATLRLGPLSGVRIVDEEPLDDELRALQSPLRRRLPQLLMTAAAAALMVAAFVGASSLVRPAAPGSASPVVAAPARSTVGNAPAIAVGASLEADAPEPSPEATRAPHHAQAAHDVAAPIASHRDDHPHARPATRVDDSDSDADDDPDDDTVEEDPSVTPTGAAPAPRPSSTAYAETIRAVARTHDADVIGCYGAAMPRGGGQPSGEVNVGFLVGTNGRAKLINIVSNTLGRADVGHCLAALVATWSFPPPPGGDFGLTYPFVFEAR